MKKALYVRVSSEGQNTERQMKIGFKIYPDKCSGSIAFNKRTQALNLLHDIEQGLINEVHVHSIDRLGRNTLDIMQTIQLLTAKGVNVVSEKEGLRTLNDDGSENMVSKMLVGILGTLAEFELNRLKERQKEGIEKAKQRGAYKTNGRPKETEESVDDFMKKSKVKRIVRYLEQGNSIRSTAKLSECSVGLVQKVVSYQRLVKVESENKENNYVPFVDED